MQEQIQVYGKAYEDYALALKQETRASVRVKGCRKVMQMAKEEMLAKQLELTALSY